MPIADYGFGPADTYQVHDLITGKTYLWKGERNYVELDPHVEPANVFVVRKWVSKEENFDYY